MEERMEESERLRGTRDLSGPLPLIHGGRLKVVFTISGGHLHGNCMTSDHSLCSIYNQDELLSNDFECHIYAIIDLWHNYH